MKRAEVVGYFINGLPEYCSTRHRVYVDLADENAY